MPVKPSVHSSTSEGCPRKRSRIVRFLCLLFRSLFESKPVNPPSKEVQEAMRRRQEIAWEAHDIIRRSMF